MKGNLFIANLQLRQYHQPCLRVFNLKDCETEVP